MFWIWDAARGSSRLNAPVTGIASLVWTFFQPVQGQALEQYFCADLDAGIGSVIGKLQGKRFDRVLLLDVLEHLVHPHNILRDCREVLSPAGALVVSVPNIANITTRLMLFFGRFNYADRGILDRTHVKFFTRKTARALLEENGYRVLEEKFTVMPLERVTGVSAASPAMKFLNYGLSLLTRAFPGLFGYQVMFLADVAKPPD